MNAHPHIEVLDCCETSRREFLKKAGLSAAALATAPTLFAKKKAAEP
ncbi:MAG: twin-arginine translocation signal domain-containing protein, partial [Limisphaerales bacterium]